MKKYLVFLFVFLLTSVSLISQVSQSWVARYNGTSDSTDVANAIALDGSGNVYVTGYSMGSGTGYDYATIKYNSSGVQQWVQRYNGPANSTDMAYSIAVDGSGNVYITGQSENSSAGFDLVTIKYNTNGVQQWLQRYSNANIYEDPVLLTIDASGDVYVTGTVLDTLMKVCYGTIKYNSSGVQQWVQTYRSPSYRPSNPAAIALDNLNDVYVTGTSLGGSQPKIATVKYNTNGVLQWVEVYNGYQDETGSAMSVDASGNAFISGWAAQSTIGFVTVKYTPSGSQRWGSYHIAGSGPGPSANVIDGFDNIYVTGACAGTGYDYLVIKYDSTGSELWAKTFNGAGNGNDIPNAITLDNSGNVYVTGNTTGTGMNYDYGTVKYDASGNQKWVETYNGPGNGDDLARAIVVDASGNVYVTGDSYGSSTGFDYATIKYSQPLGINPINSNIPKQYSLSQNYPNPFNPTTKIWFSLPSPSEGGAMNTKLMVYDVLGREVATLVNESLKPGSYEVSFDANNFASGLYFYKLTAGLFVETKKMILTK